MSSPSKRAASAADAPTEQAAPKPLVPGVASALSPLVRRILAPNPGMMTGPGTNCYLVGVDEIAVIDPGPADDSHLEAIVGCGGDRIRWILATHHHVDHWPGAVALAERTGAEVLGFATMGEFTPTRTLADGDTVEGTEFRLRAVHTPGHASDHLCYLLEQERLLFSGDHVMQGSTVVINPPDGDMGAYLASLERLRSLRPKLRAIAPGHGYVIEDPAAVLTDYIEHRLDRERQVAEALAAAGDATTQTLVEAIYTDVDPMLHPMARRSVWAHLRKLAADGRATSADVDDPDASWQAA